MDDNTKIRLAAEALYYAGLWECDSVHPTTASQLWTSLRDALGLSESDIHDVVHMPPKKREPLFGVGRME